MKKYLIGGAIAVALAVGGYMVYQNGVKPQVENAIVQLLEDTKAQVAAKGDGSSLSYSEVKLQGAAAVVTDITYVDGPSQTTQKAESLTITATPSTIHSATVKNYTVESDSLEMAIQGRVDEIAVKNLTIPQKNMGELSFDLISSQNMEITAQNNKVNVKFTAESSEMTNFANGKFESINIINGKLNEMNSGFGLTDLNNDIKNMHIQNMAELFLGADAAEMQKLSTKITYEGYDLSSKIVLKDKEIGDLSAVISGVELDENNAYKAFTSKMSMNLSITQDELDALNAQSENDPQTQANYDAFKQAMSEINIDTYVVSLNADTAYKDNSIELNATYDLGELANMNLDFNLQDFDLPKLTEALADLPEDATPEQASMKLMPLYMNMKIASANVTASGDKLLDLIFKLNPKMTREQLIATSQMMVPMMLQGEPSIANEAGSAVNAFLKTGKRLEINIAPEAPVAVNQIAGNVMTGKEIAPLLGVTIEGE